MTNCDTFEEVLELAEKGDHSNVDLLVQDIYGTHDYSSIGLTGKTVAASFGKAVRLSRDYTPNGAIDLKNVTEAGEAKESFR